MLLLFDIDGTLLSGAAKAHAAALHAALREVHGVDYRPERSGRWRREPAGRTDPEIARAILLAAGVSAERIDERANEVQEECCGIYARLCPPDLSDTVVPGVGELLAWVGGLPEVRLALVTGNYEPIARLKLARAGIGKHFGAGQGAFGSDSEDRAALPMIARRRAGRIGAPYPRERTIVIGDTPRDIACARADEVGCIAVATGPFGRDELLGADAVAGNAEELRTALAGALAGR